MRSSKIWWCNQLSQDRSSFLSNSLELVGGPNIGLVGRKASSATGGIQGPRSFFPVLLSLRVLPYSAWLELALQHLSIFQSEEEKEKMKGKKFPFKRIWPECSHFPSHLCNWNMTTGHAWLLGRLGKFVTLHDFMQL